MNMTAKHRYGFAGLIALAMLFSSWAGAGELPQKGDSLPALILSADLPESEMRYLGIEKGSFEIEDVNAQIILLEVIGVYCPRCVEQAPLFKNLFARIAKNRLDGKIKMLGIAAGGTAMEVRMLLQTGGYPFPVVPDERFEIHKLLGEPRTPFTLVVNRQGNILYAHLGVVEDIDALYKLMKSQVH
jgi:hypothetical protein